MSFSIRVILLSMLLIGGLGVGAVRACDLETDWKDRADWSAQRGIFFKPDAKTCPANILELMPLIVIDQADAPTNTAAPPDTSEEETRIATVGAQDRKLTVVGEVPTVYVMSSTIDAGGAILHQWMFVWWIDSADYDSPANDSLTNDSLTNDSPVMAAVRMTLDAEGQPIVWEALNELHRTVGLFVAEPFEKAVRMSHADPPDWRPSDIRNPNVHTSTSIVRVLADGPAPMGPMVYLDRRGSIVTIACRCMPSQVDQMLRNDYYRVERINDLAEIDHLLTLSGNAKFQELLGEWRRPTWLSDALRWPKGESP